MENEYKEEIIFNSKSLTRVTEDGTPVVKKKRMDMDDVMFKAKKITFTPEKVAKLAEQYKTVVVHDFDDEYHMSEEDRQKTFKYYEVFSRLKRCKRKFRKLDEYVKVYRLCIDCLEVVAMDNGVYTPQKFIKMVLKGDIQVFGLNFPKYIGKDKKDINWSYVEDYIVDRTKDPSELVKDKEFDYDDDSYESPELLYDDDEFELLMKSISNESSYTLTGVSESQLEEDGSFDKYGAVHEMSKKEFKELTQSCPSVIKSAKEAEKQRRLRNAGNNRLNAFIFSMSNDDFEEIAEIDRRRGYVSESDIPKFTGDIMNKKDYKKYLYSLEEYEMNCIKYNYKGKMLSGSEIEEIMLKETLEQAGYNVRAFYKNKQKEKALKKAYKKDKKREKELKERLTKLQARTKSRKSEIEFDSKKKKKNKKKKDKESD